MDHHHGPIRASQAKSGMARRGILAGLAALAAGAGSGPRCRAGRGHPQWGAGPPAPFPGPPRGPAQHDNRRDAPDPGQPTAQRDSAVGNQLAWRGCLRGFGRRLWRQWELDQLRRSVWTVHQQRRRIGLLRRACGESSLSAVRRERLRGQQSWLAWWNGCGGQSGHGWRLRTVALQWQPWRWLIRRARRVDQRDGHSGSVNFRRRRAGQLQRQRRRARRLQRQRRRLRQLHLQHRALRHLRLSGTGIVASTNGGNAIQGASNGNVGVLGTSNSSIGGFFASGTSTGLYATGPASGFAARFDGPVLVNGNFTAIGGSKSAAVPHPDGTHRRLYCVESPESWFEDFGREQLANGRAQVRLDPDFNALVHSDNYHVFLTPDGDTNGLYVSDRNPNGFEVREVERDERRRLQLPGRRQAQGHPRPAAGEGRHPRRAPTPRGATRPADHPSVAAAA